MDVKAMPLILRSVDESLLASGEVTMPVMIITCHYYLDDLRWELGPTRFIRGSHVAGRKPDRANAEDHLHGVPDQPLMVKAGDCVAFRSDVCKSHLPEPAPRVGCASSARDV